MSQMSQMGIPSKLCFGDPRSVEKKVIISRNNRACSGGLIKAMRRNWTFQ